MRLKILSLVLAAVLLLSLCSCTFGGEALEITVGVLSAPDCFDPLFADGDSEYIIAANCFEGLMRFEADGTLEPAGCVAYSVNADGLSYTFKLNPNARYNVTADVKSVLAAHKIEKFDESITAEDYITAFKRAIITNPDLFKNISGADSIIAGKDKGFGVTADGDTLTVKLTKADPDFLYKLAALPLVPCRAEFIDALGDDYAATPSAVLTNGAYRISDVTETGTVKLTASPAYNGKLKVMNKSVMLYFTGSKKLMTDRFNNGSYAAITASGFNTVTGAQSDYSHTENVWGLCFNLSKATVKNTNLRLAFVTATNLTSFKVPSLASGGAVRVLPSDFVIHDNNYGVTSELYDGSAVDIEKAKSLLKTALTELKTDSATLNIVVPDTILDSVKKELETNTAQLGDGIKLELSGFKANEATAVAEAGEYDIAILPLAPERLTVCAMLESIKCAPCYCQDENFEKLTADFIAQNDGDDAITAAQTAEKYLVEKAIFLPLFRTTSRLYITPQVTKIYSAANGRYIYFDAACNAGEQL